MNGIKRAALQLQIDEFLLRLIKAITELGETVEVKSKPKKGSPETYLITPDNICIKYNLYYPNSDLEFWRVDFGYSFNQYIKIKYLDSVDFATIANFVVKTIYDKRAEAIARITAGRINNLIPNREITVRGTHLGTLTMDIFTPLTEDQILAMIDTARKCGIIK
jgi:hypothetical protein